MTTKLAALISTVFLSFAFQAQTVSHIYKINDLLNRLRQPDTTFVVNFWATCCKPCVQELPGFDSLLAATKNSKIKILLVSLDFKEDIAKKVNPFLAKKHIQSECVLLDEVNGNNFINVISPSWSGAIPATLFKTGSTSELVEKKLNLSELKQHLGR